MRGAEAARANGTQQRGVRASVVARIHLRVRTQQQLDHWLVASRRRLMQRGHALRIVVIGVGMRSKEGPHDGSRGARRARPEQRCHALARVQIRVRTRTEKQRHHLGVVGELCDRVYVMYAGEVVEEAPVDTLYHAARHPYTRALMACDPAVLPGRVSPLPTIPGRLPDLVTPPSGCAFAVRCSIVQPRCRTTPPPRVTLTPGHAVLCHEVTA